MIPGQPGPLGADSFSWDDVGEAIPADTDPAEIRTTGALARPSRAQPRGLDGGTPTSLGVDRRTPEMRAADISAHRARIDAHRERGDFTTEEGLDAPRDWT